MVRGTRDGRRRMEEKENFLKGNKAFVNGMRERLEDGSKKDTKKKKN